ncbi:MAG: hypothetical protein AAB686_00820 [Patescibacteria group bacterium]
MAEMKDERSGQLLLELLLVIGAAAIIVAVGSQLIFVSLRSTDTAGDKETALGILQETAEAVRSVASEKWQTVYSLQKYSTNYYPLEQSGKWAFATGTQTSTISDVQYTRYFNVQNICRDINPSDRYIRGITDTNGTSATGCSGSGGAADPSTQKLNATVSWVNADPIIASEYITRWQNKACAQDSWTSTSTESAICPTTTYASSSNVQASSSIILCSGC